MLLTRRLQNDGAHASYRAYLKVRTIDSWLAERGTVNTLPDLRLHESFLDPLRCFVYLQLPDPAPNSASAAVHVDTIGTFL